MAGYLHIARINVMVLETVVSDIAEAKGSVISSGDGEIEVMHLQKSGKRFL